MFFVVGRPLTLIRSVVAYCGPFGCWLEFYSYHHSSRFTPIFAGSTFPDRQRLGRGFFTDSTVRESLRLEFESLL